MEEAAGFAAHQDAGIGAGLFIEDLDEGVEFGIAVSDLAQMGVHQFQRGDDSVPHERHHQAKTRSIRHLSPV